MEKPEYDGPDADVLRANIRSDFKYLKPDGTETIYKYQESSNALQKLLAVQPDNISALVFYYLVYYPAADTISEINLEIKLQQLDPNCSFGWPLRIRGLTMSLLELLENRNLAKSPGADMTGAEIKQLAKRAWATLNDMFDYIYENRDGSTKLSYAIQSIDHPYFGGDDEENAGMTEMIDVDPIEYTAKRRD